MTEPMHGLALPKVAKSLWTAEKLFLSLGLFLLTALGGSGCSTAGYKEAADRDAFALLQEKQLVALGHTNAFTIETQYSNRDPDSIEAPEVILDRDRVETVRLSLPQAIDMFFTNSPSYKSTKENLYNQALALSASRKTLGSTLYVRPTGANAGATFTRNFTVNNRSGQVTGTETANVNVSTLGMSATKLIGATGGSLSVNLANSLNEFILGNGTRQALSTLSATFTQPLLQGFGARNTTVENLTQSERSMIYNVRSFAHNQNGLAVNIVQQYLGIIQNQANVRNQWAAYGRATNQAAKSRALGLDRLSKIAVDQAANDELSAKNAYINQVESYRANLDSFKITLGLPLGTDLRLDENALEEVRALQLTPISFTPETAYAVALTNRLDILNQIDQFEDSRRRLKNEVDRLKPTLTFTGNLSMQNVGRTNYDDFFNWDINRYTATPRLDLVLPLDRLSIRNGYRQALISFDQSIRNFSSQMDTLKNNLKANIRTLNQQAQSFVIQKLSYEISERNMINTRLQYDNGDIEYVTVQTAEQNLINAQNQLLASLVTYNIARLRLLQDMGLLHTDIDKFWLEKQLPPALDIAPSASDAGSTDLTPPDTLFQK